MDRIAILDYAMTNGREEAYNLLLLIGPDGFIGSYDSYQDLLFVLTNGKEGKEYEIS